MESTKKDRWDKAGIILVHIHTAEEVGTESTKKDGSDKAGIILKPAIALVAALVLAYFGFLTSNYLEGTQQAEMRIRLYTELISKREEAESALRKDMFKSIMDSFLELKAATLEAKLLQVELLACNFHESLNLKPLFAHLKREIAGDDSTDATQKQEYLERLYTVAREITATQVAVLEVGGIEFERTIVFERLREKPAGLPLESAELELRGIKRDFRVFVIEVDTTAKEIKVSLEIDTPEQPLAAPGRDLAEFWVGLFDLPMIVNTRLSNDQRCAIVLTRFGEASAELTGVYFPGSHASLKEKPYFQEMVDNLLPDGKKTR